MNAVKKIGVIVLLLFSAHSFALSLEKDFPEMFTVRISNPLKTPRENVLIVLKPELISTSGKKFNDKAFVVLDGKKEIPSQYNDKDRDNTGIVFVLGKLNASESRDIVVRFHPTASVHRAYPKLTQAELSWKKGGEWKDRVYIGGTFENIDYLRVPPEQKDHSYFLRYEGPGWESDKVGYRFYLDQRNATDVFGKKISEPVLQQVGLDGYDSYHLAQPWGMDVMNVGKSLGIGSIGSVIDGVTTRVEKTDSVNCRITENGDVYSSILTNYYGWKIGNQKHNVQSRLSIHSGTRLTHEMLDVSGTPDNIATGLIKDKLAKLFTAKGDNTHWAYLATYGKQSLNDPKDELGIAVFFKPSTVSGYSEDEFSHIVKLNPVQGKIDYYFLAAWVGEPGGIKDEAHFLEYINTVSAELASEIKVEMKNPRSR